MDDTTQCPTCGGTGKDLEHGRIIECTDCGGAGRVEAYRVDDWYGAIYLEGERWPAFLLPVPKEYRHAESH